MYADRDDWIDRLIEAQRPGFSLDQAFYRGPANFRRDCERMFCYHWFMAGQVSQIPKQGDYFLFDVAGLEIVIRVATGTRDFAFCHSLGHERTFTSSQHRGQTTYPSKVKPMSGLTIPGLCSQSAGGLCRVSGNNVH